MGASLADIRVPFQENIGLASDWLRVTRFHLAAVSEGMRMDEVEREQTKLFANALDRASTACLAVGVLTPISAVFFAIPGYSTTPIWVVEFGVGAWMLCTLALHLMAMRALRGLQE
jgi:hypothetical protein